jgi:hypothetical protein
MAFVNEYVLTAAYPSLAYFREYAVVLPCHIKRSENQVFFFFKSQDIWGKMTS